MPRTLNASSKKGRRDASRLAARSQPPLDAPISNVSAATAATHTPSEHARYTHYFSDSSTTYSTLARLLVIIGYTELLTEMVARRKLGEKRAWNVVVGVESVKVALRAALVVLTNNRPTIQPPIPEREVDPAALEEERKAAIASLTNTNGQQAGPSTGQTLQHQHTSPASSHAEVWRGARSGVTRPTLQSIRQRAHPADATTAATSSNSTDSLRPKHPLTHASAKPTFSSAASLIDSSGSGSDSDETLVDSWTEKDVNEYLLSRTLTPNDVKKPQDLVRQMRNGMGFAAEMLWVVRPLLYVLALRRWGRKHKAPFFLSLGLEYLAGLMRVRALTPPGVVGGPSPLSNPLLMAMMGDSAVLSMLARLTGSGPKEARPISEVERQEWEKRKRAFWWYLLRGPAWHTFTRPKLESLASKTESRPLLGILGGIVRDYLPLVDDYYYYSST